MTINLLTSVPEGMVLCADSILTLNAPGPAGLVTTTFATAEKLVALGGELPAAAMVNGQGSLGGEVLSVILRRASVALDSGAFAHDATGVETAVQKTVDPCYAAALSQFKFDLAQQWSQPGWIENLNLGRANRGLTPVTQADPNRIRIVDDPASPTRPEDWDITAEFGLTLVVGSFFVSQRALAIMWPGPRTQVYVPGAPLAWWGSGGSSIARLVHGCDLGQAQRLSSDGDAGGRFILRGNTHGGVTDVAFRVSRCAFERNRFRNEFVQVAVAA